MADIIRQGIMKLAAFYCAFSYGYNFSTEMAGVGMVGSLSLNKDRTKTVVQEKHDDSLN